MIGSGLWYSEMNGEARWPFSFDVAHYGTISYLLPRTIKIVENFIPYTVKSIDNSD